MAQVKKERAEEEARRETTGGEFDHMDRNGEKGGSRGTEGDMEPGRLSEKPSPDRGGSGQVQP